MRPFAVGVGLSMSSAADQATKRQKRKRQEACHRPVQSRICRSMRLISGRLDFDTGSRCYVPAIGVDEIQYSKGHKYLTLVYQIDLGVTRLLWVGKERTIKSFQVPAKSDPPHL